MEHIVQFAIGIDDQAIVERVSKNAEKIIIEDLKKDVQKTIFDVDYGYYGNGRVKGPSNWFEQRLTEFLEANKTKIIEVAADKLADKLSRTKAAKEAAARVAEGK